MSRCKTYFLPVALIAAAALASSCGCNKTSQLMQWRENGALGSAVESVADSAAAGASDKNAQGDTLK